MPAHIDDSADSRFVFDHHRSIVFDGVMVHDIRQLTGDAQRLAKQKIQDINTMRRDIEEWTAASLGGIEQPAPVSASIEPHMIRQLGENRRANGASSDQLLGPYDLGIAATIIGDPEELAILGSCINHATSLTFVHRH